jgi:hypothetical protein
MEQSLRFYRDLLGITVAIDAKMSGEMLDKEVVLTGAHLRLVELIPGSGAQLTSSCYSTTRRPASLFLATPGAAM